MSAAVMRGVRGLAAVLLAAVAMPTWSATFPTTTGVFFQTNGCNREATIGDWYTTRQSGSTRHYSEYFLEVTETMSPATVRILDAELNFTGGDSVFDEVQGAPDAARFELRSGDGVSLLSAQNVPSGSANGTVVTFAGLATGLYRIRSYTGTDEFPGAPMGAGTYCTGTVDDNNDDNSFQIEVNGGNSIDGLLGFLQTTYQHNTGANLSYSMYFLVGPTADNINTTLNLRNFDLDFGASRVDYFQPPNASGQSIPGTRSINGIWNGPGGDINNGADTFANVNTALNGTGSAVGTWGYRISDWTNNNQTIFEANDGPNNLALTDAFPTRAGFFSITPSTTRNTVIGTPVDHPFTVTNLFFTNDVINFNLTGTSANYTTQLYRDADCSGTFNGGDSLLTDSDGNGQPDTQLLSNANAAGSSACFVLRVTPLAGANSSDTTRIQAVSLMDTKVGAANTTRFVDKLTLIPPAISKAFASNPLGVNGVTALVFTLSNVNSVALSAVQFDDLLPDVDGAPVGQMVVATPPNLSSSCGGAFTSNGAALAGGASQVQLRNGTLAANANCTISVNVTAPVSGNYNNTTTAIDSAETPPGNSANATLTVQAAVPPSVQKTFLTNPIPVNGVSVLRLTLSNANAAMALTGVAIGDTYPAGLVNTATPNPTTTCSGATITGGAANGGSIGVSGASIPANGSCTVTVNVTSATSGQYLNTTGVITSANGGNGNSASATLVVNAPPTLAKSFSPTLVNTNTASVLTLTLSNPNNAALTGAAFTDNYPSALVNAGNPNASTSCGGTVTATGSGNSVALAGGVIPANGSCTVTVSVLSATPGSYVNTVPAGNANANGLTTSNGVNSTAPTTATLTVQAVQPPVIAKSFTTSPIQVNGSSTLRIVVSNPNSTTVLNGVAFTDTYPTNLVNRNPANAAISCTAGNSGNLTGGANGGGTLGLSSGTLQPGGSCTLTVDVTSAVGSVAGTDYVNSTGPVTSTNGGTGNTATATLTVRNGLVAPSIVKSFDPDSLGVSGISRLTFTITNPNNATLFNVAFNDNYPANLVNAANADPQTTCNFATINSTGTGVGTGITGGANNGNSIGLSGAVDNGGSPNDLPANAVCTLSVNVTSTVGSTAGTLYTNTTTTAINGRDANGAGANTFTGVNVSDTITFFRPNISKAFSPAIIPAGGSSTLTITLTNNSAVAFTGAAFTDSLPPNTPSTGPGAMTTTGNATTTCGGTPSQTATTVSLAGGTIPAGGSCTVSVAVTASAAGSYVNTIAAGGLTTANGGSNPADASATLTVPGAPMLSKAFSPNTILVGQNSTLTITLSNNNASSAASSAAFTDNLPSGVTVSGTPSTGCGGTLTNSATSVTLTGGTIPAGAPGTCTVVLTVTAQASGTYVNTIATGALTSSNGSNPAPATATLFVNPPLTVAKSSTVFSDPTGQVNPKRIPGAIVTYSITVANAGAGLIDSGTVVIFDPLPPEVELVTSDFNGVGGAGPVQFVQGTPSSGLTYTYGGLGSGADDLAFSNNSGASYAYTPVVGGSGTDPAVNVIRINPKGAMQGPGAGTESFTINFRARIK